MKLNSNSLNIRYDKDLQSLNKIKNKQSGNFTPSFKGASGAIDDIAEFGKSKIFPEAKKAATSFLKKAGNTVSDFVRNHITSGIDVKYEYSNEVMEALRKNFGSTFDDCLKSATGYTEQVAKKAASSNSFLNKASTFNNDAFRCVLDKKNNTITFHKNPFAKNILDGVKDFTGGMFLDACIGIRNGFRKYISKTTPENVSKFGQILDNRVAKKQALDSFYRLAGAFEQANEGISTVIAKNAGKTEEAMKGVKLGFIKSNISKLAGDSVEAATKKVGQYNTKTERAFNRLATGFVSATFAAKDFYNISMLQKDNKDEANAAGHKRFAQDMRRQTITAGITFIVLGAFQNKVNKSMFHAVLSLGGVTFISEILSRKLGGIPLKPLSSDEAAKQAEKQKKKKEKLAFKKGKEQKEDKKSDEVKESTLALNNTVQNSPFPSTMTMPLGYSGQLSNDSKNVFDVFTNKQTNTANNTTPSFTSNDENKAENTKKEDQLKNTKKKTSNILHNALKVMGGIVGASLVIGFLRSKNILNIDTIIKEISGKYKNFTDKLTTKELILPQNQVDDFMNYLQDSGFKQQHSKLSGVMSDIKENHVLDETSGMVRKLIKAEDIKEGSLFYDMGKVDAKGRKTLVNVITYPINAISKLIKSANTVSKRIFVKEAGTAKAELSKETAVSFIQTYSEKYKKAVEQGKVDEFNKEIQNAFSRHFSEANSKNKNTTIALMSRFLITVISGYFFVNDYRNEVLIESKGKDVERANATAKERIGHKVANFFLNSMFMDIFNSTFENIYLKSVPGAVAVAMATEYTNESAVRASICTPRRKMNKEQLIEYEDKRLNDKGIRGKYYRFFMKLTGKKPLSQKANKKK